MGSQKPSPSTLESQVSYLGVQIFTVGNPVFRRVNLEWTIITYTYFILDNSERIPNLSLRIKRFISNIIFEGRVEQYLLTT